MGHFITSGLETDYRTFFAAMTKHESTQSFAIKIVTIPSCTFLHGLYDEVTSKTSLTVSRAILITQENLT